MWAEIPTLPSLPIDQTLVNRQIPIFAIQQMLGYLDLLKSPDAWLGAENDVSAAIEGIEESIALLMEDYAGGGTMPIYDSGLFFVSSNNTYTKSHGLGKIPDFVQVWYSPHANGLVQYQVSLNFNPAFGQIRDFVSIDYTDIIIRTVYYVVSSTHIEQPSGYYRVVAM